MITPNLYGLLMNQVFVIAAFSIYSINPITFINPAGRTGSLRGHHENHL